MGRGEQDEEKELLEIIAQHRTVKDLDDILKEDQGVVRQIKREHIRQIKSGLIHGNCQKTVGLSSLISSDYKKKKLPMQIKTQAVS